MISAVFVAALASAVMHAGWNMLAKSVYAPRDVLFGISIATASLCGIAMPFFGLPATACWPWIGAASVCNVLYLYSLTAAYADCQFASVYAVTRAVIPPLLFVLGWLFLAEPVRLSALIGLVLVILGLLIFAKPAANLRDLNRRSLLIAAAAGLLLACALLCDVKGIRAGGGGVVNLLRFAIVSSLTTAAVIVVSRLVRRVDALAPLKDNAGLCYVGSALLTLSYLCGMWAYTQGPVALVATVRESGILVAAGLAIVLLHERVTERQWAAMAIASIGMWLVQTG